MPRPARRWTEIRSWGAPRLTGLFIREDPGTLYTFDGTQVAGERFADSIAAVEEISVSLTANLSIRRKRSMNHVLEPRGVI